MLADWFAEVHPRMAATLRVAHEAAVVDPDVAASEEERAMTLITDAVAPRTVNTSVKPPTNRRDALNAVDRRASPSVGSAPM